MTKALPTDNAKMLRARARRVFNVASKTFRESPISVASEALIEAMAAHRHADQLEDDGRRDLFVATAAHINEAEHKLKLAFICVFPGEDVPL